MSLCECGHTRICHFLLFSDCHSCPCRKFRKQEPKANPSIIVSGLSPGATVIIGMSSNDFVEMALEQIKEKRINASR